MSGGYFDYQQYKLQDMIDSITEEIKLNDEKDEWGESRSLKQETLNEFLHAIKLLKEAYIYTHRIDWLLSGDDGEETFHERLAKELGNAKCDT